MDASDSDTQQQPTDLQILRRTARQRFIGAAVLVLVAVIALPFVLDTKPRPVSPDIAIEIKAPAAEIAKPATSSKPEPVTQIAPAAPVAPVPPLTPAAPSPVTAASQATPPLAFKPEPVTKPEPTPTPKPEPAAKPDEAAKANEAARAAALLNGGGYHIQAGSFTDKDKVQAVQDKLNKSGFQSFTQDAVGKDGATYTRIRLGPYPTQQEANNVAARIGKLGIKTIVVKP